MMYKIALSTVMFLSYFTLWLWYYLNCSLFLTSTTHHGPSMWLTINTQLTSFEIEKNHFDLIADVRLGSYLNPDVCPRWPDDVSESRTTEPWRWQQSIEWMGWCEAVKSEVSSFCFKFESPFTDFLRISTITDYLYGLLKQYITI